MHVIIRGELSPDAAPFTAVANNITDRPTTGAGVPWSIEAYTEIGQRVQSPDLAALIQEIIDQPGWAAGNGLALIISDDPDNPSTGLRESEAGPGDDSATLVIEAFIPFARNPAPANWQTVLMPWGGLELAALAEITITATGGTVCVAELKATADHQVMLVNPSFELPGTIKHKGFGDVAGWNTDAEPVASGVEAGYRPTDGYWTAYLKGSDPGPVYCRKFELQKRIIRFFSWGKGFIMVHG